MSGFDNYSCEGQMSIFDLMPRDSKDFTQMTISEIADEIGRAIGLTFQQDKRKGWEDTWYCERRHIRFEIHLSKYFEDCIPETNHTADGSFIGVRVADRNFCGQSGPTDSLEEAIEFFKKQMSRYHL